MQKWDRRFLELAQHISGWSRDPSTHVGAVLVNANRCVVGMGYNGFPRGVDDNQARYDDRAVKYQYVVHAEVNAILNAVSNTVGTTLYTYPLCPCNECTKLIVQAGISQIVVPFINGVWRDPCYATLSMLREANIGMRRYDYSFGKFPEVMPVSYELVSPRHAGP